jgi:P-type Cu+ transporter
MSADYEETGPRPAPAAEVVGSVAQSRELIDAERTIEGFDLARIVIVVVAAAVVWFRIWEPFPRVSAIGLTATLLGIWPILREAWSNLRQRKMTMELSMTIAIVAALVIGEFFTALIITAFVLVAEVLEELTVGRGRRAIRSLLDFLPRVATVRQTGGPLQIPLSQVRVGDLVLVAPGERLPVDGTVIAGHSYVDQSTITGESTPVEKGQAETVYAGTINQTGALEIRADRLGKDTSFGKIVEAVERAERSRAPIQRTADRYAGYLVFFALGAAVLTFLITRDARPTISVVIVAGACGIAAGTPLAILGAVGRSAREGAIVKGGRYLEALARVDTVAFDKTGTLTTGVTTVESLEPSEGVNELDLLKAAATAEQRSEHPLGRAVLEKAAQAGIPTLEPDTFDYAPGRGIVARVGKVEIVAGSRSLLADHGIRDLPPLSESSGSVASRVLVGKGGVFLGTIRIGDAIRSEARAAVGDLRAMGIRTVLLTGDARPIGESVSREVGMDDVRADLLPEAKVEAIRELVAQGHTVAMVGDGVNDAPALTEATVGVAMGSGTDVARESADVVLLGSDLSKLVETIRIARRAKTIIRFNFVGTIGVDILGIALAALGILNPLMAAFIHVASELTFILNSARLLPPMSRREHLAGPTATPQIRQKASA